MKGTEVVEPIVGGFSELLKGCSDGIIGLFQKLFMNSTVVDGVTTYSGISAFGIWTLAFIGVGLAIAILRRVTGKVL